MYLPGLMCYHGQATPEGKDQPSVTFTFAKKVGENLFYLSRGSVKSYFFETCQKQTKTKLKNKKQVIPQNICPFE